MHFLLWKERRLPRLRVRVEQMALPFILKPPNSLMPSPNWSRSWIYLEKELLFVLSFLLSTPPSVSDVPRHPGVPCTLITSIPLFYVVMGLFPCIIILTFSQALGGKSMQWIYNLELKASDYFSNKKILQINRYITKYNTC